MRSSIPFAEDDPEVLARIIAFREGLEALGWTENRNIRIEHRYSGGELDQIRAYATELVRSAPERLPKRSHVKAEVEAAITAFAREPGGGLIAAPDAFINNHRRVIMALTQQSYRLL